MINIQIFLYTYHTRMYEKNQKNNTNIKWRFNNGGATKNTSRVSQIN